MIIMLIVFLVLLTIALVACWLMLHLALSAVALSKVVFSLIVAALLNSELPFLPEREFWSFSIWAVIALVCCFALCRLPRFNCAFQYFCNFGVSYFLTRLMVAICMSIFTKSDTLAIGWEIAITVGCVLVSLLALFSQLRNYKMCDLSKYKAVKYIDRVISSLVYGIIAVLICAVTLAKLDRAPIVDWIVFLSIIALSYGVDCLLFDRLHQLMVKNIDKWDRFVADGQDTYLGVKGAFGSLLLSIWTVGELLTPDSEEDDYYDYYDDDDF